MAEIKINDKYHYVTLTTLAKNSTFINKGLPYLTKFKNNDENKKQVAEYTSKLITATSDIKEALEKDKNNFIITSEIDQTEIDIITSTRLLKPEQGKSPMRFALTEIANAFPGMNISEIRIFSNNYDKFKAELTKYVFAEKRTEGDIQKLFEGFKDPTGKKSVPRLSGKPYVVVSYANDIEGSSGNKTSAKIVPITSVGRSMQDLTKEVIDLKEVIDEEIGLYFLSAKGKEGYTYETAKNSFKISVESNAKAETLLDKSQVLDILIEWARTPHTINGEEKTLLDLLTEPIAITGPDLGQQTKTLVNLLDNFRKIKGNSLTKAVQGFTNVINHINTFKHLKEAKDVKEEVLNEIKNDLGWVWNFHNLFAYENIIETQTGKDLSIIMAQMQINPDFFYDEFGSDYETFSEYTKILVETLKNKTFYYSIPIKPDGVMGTKVNTSISGINGFSEEFFSDKFYIDVIPESERSIIPLHHYLEPQLGEITKGKTTKVVVNENTVVEPPKVEPVIEGSFMKAFSSIENINGIMSKLLTKYPEIVQNFDDELPNFWKLIPGRFLVGKTDIESVSTAFREFLRHVGVPFEGGSVNDIDYADLMFFLDPEGFLDEDEDFGESIESLTDFIKEKCK